MSANNSTIPLSKLTCASVLQANGSNVPPLQANADIAGIGVCDLPTYPPVTVYADESLVLALDRELSISKRSSN